MLRFARSTGIDRWLGTSTLLWQIRLLSCLCAFVVAASLVLGGGTRGGFLSDAILQLLSVPLLLVALWHLFEVPLTKQMRVPLLFCLALVAVPLIQLVPLPPWLWTALPGRDLSAEAFEILGQQPPWMPISVSPHETWLSALSLISPVAIFLATLQLDYRHRSWLSLVFVAVGVVSVFLGLLQVAQGTESLLRFFEISNPTEAVGFFANRNHFAAFLYSVTLFSMAWAVHATAWGERAAHRRYDTLLVVAIIGVFTLLVVLLAGQFIARSRMGLGLTIIALLGGVALGASDRRLKSSVTSAKLFIGAGVLVFIFGLQFALYRFMERFAVDPLEDARLPFGSTTIEAAIDYMPLGSGLGTFVPVYATFERPEDTILNTFVNHAHNDFLELWLNTGVVGLALAGMFVIWLGLRSVGIWRSVAPAGANAFDWTLTRAATIVVGLLLAHSLFDYPLRTSAMMAVMAFACALMIEPPLGAEGSVKQMRTVGPKRKRLADTASVAHAAPPAVPTPQSTPMGQSSSEAGPLSPDQRWGADVEWPDEWSKSSNRSSASDHKARNVPKPTKGS